MTLVIFDFDGTLFRSPAKPLWWTEPSWWSRPASLDPPLVPAKPGKAWWNLDVVAEVRPGAVLLSARKETFKPRIAELLSQVGLKFRTAILKSLDETASSEIWKASVVVELAVTGDHREVEIYEDDEKNLTAMASALADIGVAVTPHLVPRIEHPVAVSEGTYRMTTTTTSPRSAKIVTAAPVYVYHGTATGTNDWLMKRILKEGLNPFPKKRVFNTQRGDSGSQHSKEISSYGGVYFTHSPERAWVYMRDARTANGGDGLLVVARIETRSPGTAGDEDRFGLPGGAYSDLLGEYFRVNSDERPGSDFDILRDTRFDWNTPARFVLEHSMALDRHRSSPQKIEALVPVMADFLHWNTLYAWVREDQRGQIWSHRESYELRELVAGLGLTYDKVYQKFRQAHDLLLRKMKQLVEVPSKEDFWIKQHTFRYLEPVGYKGSNHIVAVLRVDTPMFYRGKRRYNSTVTVLYKTSEADALIKTMLEELQKSEGPHMLWLDRSGDVIYDNPDPEAATKAAVAGKARAMKKGTAKRYVPKQFVAPASRVAEAIGLRGGSGTVGFSYEEKRWVVSHNGTRQVSPLSTIEVYEIYRSAITRKELDEALQLSEQQIGDLPEAELYDLTATVVTELETLGEKVRDIEEVWKRLRAARLLRLTSAYKGKIVQIKEAVLQYSETAPSKPYAEILKALVEARPELSQMVEEITAAKMASKVPTPKLEKYITRTEPSTWKKKPHETVAALPEIKIDARGLEKMLLRHISVLDRILASLTRSNRTAAVHLAADKLNPEGLQQAVKLLQGVDFGQDPTKGLPVLEKARKLVLQSGVQPADIELAIRTWAEDPEKARGFIYGPSGRGSNKGAIADLTAIINKT